MDIQEHWNTIYNLSRRTLRSSFHFAFATVNPDGTPHVTPIASLTLRRSRPEGYFFELFTSTMIRNIEYNQSVCVLAVNSQRRFWLASLWYGRFATPPAVRLIGKIGERRRATPEEIAIWRRRLRLLRLFKGYDILWRDLSYVRDVQFERIEPVTLAAMTQDLPLS